MKNLILLISLLMLISCYTNDEDAESPPPYYQFIEEDFEKLLPYQENQILTYRNEDNEERSYIVTSIKTEKQDYGCCGTLGPPTTYTVFYYYDSKRITLKEFPNGNNFWKYYFSRKPPFNNEPNPNIKFYGSIDDFPFWNGQLSDENDSYVQYYTSIEYDEVPISMVVNEFTFSKVHIINSNNPDTINSNVNIIYFDEVEGIIGFDDLENNKWRIVN